MIFAYSNTYTAISISVKDNKGNVIDVDTDRITELLVTMYGAVLAPEGVVDEAELLTENRIQLLVLGSYLDAALIDTVSTALKAAYVAANPGNIKMVTTD